MTSIFDPPAGARAFNASDWLAATLAPARSAGVDGQLQAPPSAPADDEPITGDAPPYRVPPAGDAPLPTWDTQPAATPRRLRNLPIAVLAWLVIAGGIAAVGYAVEGWTLFLLIGLAVMTLELLAWLGLAWRFDRL